jgi:hypothetical protein
VKATPYKEGGLSNQLTHTVEMDWQEFFLFHFVSHKTGFRFMPVMCSIRVARWFVFKPKIPIWLNFGGSCYGKSRYIL